MAQPYIGEIRMFAGNFAPVGWEFCNGQEVAISENDALFTLIGTTYGGDGQQSFNLPDLQGRVPVHQGVGPGLGNYVIGDKLGVEQVTLTTQQIPVHTHAFVASTAAGTTTTATDNVLATSQSLRLYLQAAPDSQLPPNTISPAGGSQPHENLMPYLTVSFIISMFGIFPQQN